MSESHTPGAWSLAFDEENPEGAQWGVTALDGGVYICDCFDKASSATSTGEANARLIAAAPLLLAALEVVVRDWTQQFERNGHLAPAWCKQARIAIELATTKRKEVH